MCSCNNYGSGYGHGSSCGCNNYGSGCNNNAYGNYGTFASYATSYAPMVECGGGGGCGGFSGGLSGGLGAGVIGIAVLILIALGVIF